MRQTSQGDSDSEKEEGGGEGASRRFFPKKRRSSSNDVPISNAERLPPEGRLRRMSNAMSRRPRTLQASAAPGEADHSGSVHPALPPEQQNGRSSGGIRSTDGTAELSVSGENASAPGNQGAAGEETAEEELPPPFTMALAVMLTGLRLFLVDQVGGIVG